MRRASSFRGESPRKSPHPSLQPAIEERLHRDEAEALGFSEADMRVEGTQRRESVITPNWAQAEARRLFLQALRDEEMRQAREPDWGRDPRATGGLRMTRDVAVIRQGSLHVVYPETKAAREWLEEHTDATWVSGGVVVEPRYTVDLLLGMQEDGLTVPLEEKSPA